LWLFENLKNEVNFKILDVGCSESLLCFELVARKYDVYGVDTRDYRGKPAMLKFFKADAAKLPFSDNFFNQITMISTLEHIGIGAFNDPKYEGAETEVLNELKRILSKEGKLYLSVPYCDKYTVTWQRYYDRETLNKLLDGNFNIISKTIYIRDKSRWIRCEEKDVSGIATNRTNCIACLMLSKK
jgi:ubiquinone/menaquinone biosynthesis C-methylase UbiE